MFTIIDDIVNLMKSLGKDQIEYQIKINDSDRQVKSLSKLARNELEYVKRIKKHGSENTLIELAKNGDYNGVTYILQLKVDPDLKDRDSALIWDTYNGHVETSKNLLSKGADPNIIRVDGITDLILAIENNQNKMVKLLLAKGADLNIQDGNTALSLAIENGYTEIFDLLTANPNISDT